MQEGANGQQSAEHSYESSSISEPNKPASKSVKIGVPGNRTAVSIARPGTAGASISSAAASSSSSSARAAAHSQAQSTAFQESVANANLTMSELCASSFYKKHVGKRERQDDAEPAAQRTKSKKDNTAAAVAAAAAEGALASAPVRTSAIGNVDSTLSTGPRVEVINGKIVVKESSLLLNNVPTAVEDDYEEVYESAHATATYSSFLKRRPSPAWGIEETRLFYSALRQTGLQFTMLQAFFPGRTRLQLKRKYLREQQSHPDLVDLALNTSLPLDLTPFEAQLGDLSSGSIENGSGSAPVAVDDNDATSSQEAPVKEPASLSGAVEGTDVDSSDVVEV